MSPVDFTASYIYKAHIPVTFSPELFSFLCQCVCPHSIVGVSQHPEEGGEVLVCFRKQNFNDFAHLLDVAWLLSHCLCFKLGHESACRLLQTISKSWLHEHVELELLSQGDQCIVVPWAHEVRYWEGQGHSRRPGASPTQVPHHSMHPKYIYIAVTATQAYTCTLY